MRRIRMAIILVALLVLLIACTRDINQGLIEAAKKGDTAAVKALQAAGPREAPST